MKKEEVNKREKVFIKVLVHTIHFKNQRDYLLKFLEGLREDIKQNRPIEGHIQEFLDVHLSHYKDTDDQLENDLEVFTAEDWRDALISMATIYGIN